MRYKIIREPYMLLETVSTLFRYVNSMPVYSSTKRKNAPMHEAQQRVVLQRAERIRHITAEVCRDVDRNDPELQRFFSIVECGCEYTCLAQILTLSFFFYTTPHTGFRDQIEAICRQWRKLQEEGYWLSSNSTIALLFSCVADCPGDLIRQIKALNYSGDFRVELFDVLTHFDETMNRLAELIEPISKRLEQVFRDEPQLLDELWDYWEEKTSEMQPDEMLRMFGAYEAEDAVDETHLAVTLMNSNVLAAMGAKYSAAGLPYNIILIGSTITPNSISVRDSGELDSVSAVLKCLADRKRLEILHRLAKERSYGLALAEAIGMDPGHVSRNLGMMHNYGFIKQERETLRTYYRADREALHEFLMRVEESVFS